MDDDYGYIGLDYSITQPRQLPKPRSESPVYMNFYRDISNDDNQNASTSGNHPIKIGENLNNLSIDDLLNKKQGPDSINGGTFQSKNEALDYIYGAEDHFERNPTIISIEVNFRGVSHPFKNDIFEKFLEKFDSARSVLISFESLEDKSCSFYWRFKNSRNFFTLNIESEESTIVEFVRRFLLNSLKHNHNGLLSSFIYDTRKINNDVTLHCIGDARGFDMLSVACLSNDIEGVKRCLALGFDVHVNVKGQTAADLAYNGQNFAILLELLKANSLFPSNFNLNEVSDEIKSFVKIGKSMHENIKANNATKVNEIINKNPFLRHFYDIENHSAMNFVLALKNFEIYEIFTEKNIFFGPKEDIDGILSHLTSDDKKNLEKINKKYKKAPPSKHLLIMLANSIVGHEADEIQDRFVCVHKTFTTLDKIPLVTEIIKSVAVTRNFKINFNFSRDSFRHVNATAESYKNGLFNNSGRIVIAAKTLLHPQRQHIGFGLLAHELCHFALFSFYKNFGNPYASNDRKSQANFKNIIKECKEKRDKNAIIDLVYQHYPEDMQGAELIARVPQILAHFHNQKDNLNDFKIPFATLFYFYQEKVVMDLKRSLKVKEEEVEEEIKGNYIKIVKDYKILKILFYVLIGLFGSFVVTLLVLSGLYVSREAIMVEADLGNNTGRFTPVRTLLSCNFSGSGNHAYRCAFYNVTWILRFDSVINKVKGDHDEGKNNEDVKYFCTVNSIITQFPHNLEKFFPSLESIHLPKTQMEVIHKESVSPLKELRVLNLKENKLKIIGYELFKENLKLKEIHLNKNKIMKIFPQAFKNTNSLSTLKLSDNTCYSKSKDVSLNRGEISKYITEVYENCSCAAFIEGKCLDYFEDDFRQNVLIAIITISVVALLILIPIVVIYWIVYRTSEEEMNEDEIEDDYAEPRYL